VFLGKHCQSLVQTLVPVIMYHLATTYSVTDKQTDRQTNDIMIADYAACSSID